MRGDQSEAARRRREVALALGAGGGRPGSIWVGGVPGPQPLPPSAPPDRERPASTPVPEHRPAVPR